MAPDAADLLRPPLPSAQKGFNRANLRFEVRWKDTTPSQEGLPESLVELAAFIQAQPRQQAGIVYCLSREDCEGTAKELVRSLPYSLPHLAASSSLLPTISWKHESHQRLRTTNTISTLHSHATLWLWWACGADGSDPCHDGRPKHSSLHYGTQGVP